MEYHQSLTVLTLRLVYIIFIIFYRYEAAVAMYPSTNNALERNNGILNQYYTNRTRQSVPALVKKLGEFLKDQVNLDKELQEIKLNHEDLKLAQAFLDKHTDYFAEKDL